MKKILLAAAALTALAAAPAMAADLARPEPVYKAPPPPPAPVYIWTGCYVGGDTVFTIHAKKYEQAIRSELVWRFNWGGTVRPY